jgi:hypothetical protein
MSPLFTTMDRPKFLPPRLGSLKLWLDSSDISTITKDGSNKVSQWNDKSVNANNALQATGTAQPTWLSANINIRDAVDFTAAGIGVTVASSSSIDNFFATGGTLAFVFNIDSAGASNLGRVFDKTTSSTGINMMFQTVSGSTTKLAINQTSSSQTGAWVMTNFGITFTTTYVATVQYNASTISTVPIIRLNGVQQAMTVTTAGSGTATSDAGKDLVIGNRAALDRGMDGRMPEFIMLNRTLTAEELTNLENHLANKWGVTI